MKISGWTVDTARKIALIYLGLLLWWSIEILGGMYREVSLIEPDVPSLLIGLLVYLVITGALVGIEAWAHRVFPDAWRWTAAGLIVVLVFFRLGLGSPLALAVVAAAGFGAIGGFRLVSPPPVAGPSAGILWLLALSPDWAGLFPSGPVRESLVGVGGLLGLVLTLRGIEVLGSRGWFSVRRIRALVVGGVLIVILVSGSLWVGWGGSEKPSDYFTGTVPDLRAPGDRTLKDLPNIILISIDTLRADIVPPQADDSLAVPALRSLYEDSVRFTQMISTSSWTLPSHASLFTGLLPMEHGAVKDRGLLLGRKCHLDGALSAHFMITPS